MIKKITLTLLLTVTTIPVFAEDLAQIYTLALKNDPLYQEAEATYRANKEAVPQAIARFLPVLSSTLTTSGVNTTLPLLRHNSYNSHDYGINLSQPLFHVEHWAGYQQASESTKAAATQYALAGQDLILRVANRYFAILARLDGLHFARGQRKAFAKQLEQAKQRFEVGLIAITDVHEARARHDSAVAEEVVAYNNVDNAIENLKEIIGVDINVISPVVEKLPLLPPKPNNPEQWVQTTLAHNPELNIAKYNSKIAKLDIINANTGHIPSLDFNASVDKLKNPLSFESPYTNKQITLNLNIPIFQGGAVLSKTREARALYDKALKEVDFQRRTHVSNTLQSFRTVLSDISEVHALNQAVVSNQSALAATQAAYEAGTRTIVDVLNSQSRLLNAERDQAQSRYTYLLEGLNLKNEAGCLSVDDIMHINQYLMKPNHPWPEQYQYQYKK